LQASRIAPSLPVPCSDAAVCLSRLGRWREAIEQAQKALQLGPPSLATLDALSHAHGELGLWEEVRTWGHKALEARKRQFEGPPAVPVQPVPLPPGPSPSTRDRNVIAFSLFGALPKYCETAVLNTCERERLYPNWTCHFFVDESVPEHVLQRLDASGARLTLVSTEAKRLPGTMWRFFACDEPGVHRAIFRDADSVISEREARAVTEWIESGERFHHMRDASSHTELLMAGLWGCVGGALPPMGLLIQRFMAKPLASQHFADQHFLREMVWPYARESLLQHDSLFGFLSAGPFPDGPRRDDFHVGCGEGSTRIGMQSPFPDGTRVHWTIYEKQTPAKPVCTYPGVSMGGQVKAEVPSRLAHALKAGELLVRYEKADP
jgi:hypothetical protein